MAEAQDANTIFCRLTSPIRLSSDGTFVLVPFPCPTLPGYQSLLLGGSYNLEVARTVNSNGSISFQVRIPRARSSALFRVVSGIMCDNLEGCITAVATQVAAVGEIMTSITNALSCNVLEKSLTFVWQISQNANVRYVLTINSSSATSLFDTITSGSVGAARDVTVSALVNASEDEVDTDIDVIDEDNDNDVIDEDSDLLQGASTLNYRSQSRQNHQSQSRQNHQSQSRQHHQSQSRQSQKVGIRSLQQRHRPPAFQCNIFNCLDKITPSENRSTLTDTQESVPNILITIDTIRDQTDLGLVTMTIRDTVSYECISFPPDDNCHKANDNCHKTCPERIVERTDVIETVFQKFINYNLVVQGEGCTLRDKINYLITKYNLPVDSIELFLRVGLYGALKYILARLMYGFFDSRILLRQHNKRFMMDLSNSVFCQFINAFRSPELRGIGCLFKYSLKKDNRHHRKGDQAFIFDEPSCECKGACKCK